MSTIEASQLKNVKVGQQLVIYAILLNIVFLILQFLAGREGMAPVFLIALPVALSALGLSLFGMYKLTTGLGYELAWRIVFCILMLVPCASLIVLLVMNSKATNVLRTYGYKVGLLGAKGRRSQ